MQENPGSISSQQPEDKKDGRVNLGRHQAQCSICQSSCREAIDELFVDWTSPDELVKKYTSLSRDAIYRHAHAYSLFDQRRKNMGRALEKIIERLDWTSTTGSDILSAIKMLMKMESPKQAEDPAHENNQNKLIARRSPAESAASTPDAALPERSPELSSATLGDGHQGGSESGSESRGPKGEMLQ